MTGRNSDYLRVPSFTLSSLFELSSHLQEPPSKDMCFPVRRDVYEDLPIGKDIFFYPSSDTDCKAFMYEVAGPLLGPLSRIYDRVSFIVLWMTTSILSLISYVQ